ncbi:glycosyltransferase [Candidatus Woesearchaeota archaeon]|nr:glycosyltransferase [Candidatus Woesearchaeota archaeon]
METMRLLFITSKFARFINDPQPPFVYDLAVELVGLGHEVHVVAPHDQGSKKRELMNGINVYRFQYFLPASLQRLSYGPGIPANINRSIFAQFQMPFFATAEIGLARKISRQVNPDVVHAHWGFPQGLAARYTKKPYVVTFYGGETFLARRFRMIGILSGIVSHSCRSFALSTGLRDIMHEFGVKGNVEIMPLGVDTLKFKPKADGFGEIKDRFKGDMIVLCVARLVEKKGINYLIEAFERVLKKVPDSRLLIIGTGPMEAYLRRLASNLGDRVVFCGEIPHSELPKYYAAADLFVLPSIIDKTGDRETQGVVYLEAMASRVPVIGTNTGGIPDVIRDGVGVMVDEKDSVVLASEISRLLIDGKLRKSMGEKAFKHVLGSFSWKKIAERYVDAYRSCLK